MTYFYVSGLDRESRDQFKCSFMEHYLPSATVLEASEIGLNLVFPA